jgi:acyl-CoA synthetase (AMP-forming)/AMP-acid ligase II
MCLDAGSDAAPAICEMSESVRITAKEVEVALGEALPSYYVPTMFMPVSSMPMTTSGKLDRKVLRQLAADVPEAGRAPYRLAGNSGRAPSGHVDFSSLVG